jgi:hypothetical protein
MASAVARYTENCSDVLMRLSKLYCKHRLSLLLLCQRSDLHLIKICMVRGISSTLFYGFQFQSSVHEHPLLPRQTACGVHETNDGPYQTQHITSSYRLNCSVGFFCK